MTINVYELGQKVRCSVTFTVNNVNTDPTTVRCKVKDPGGVVTTYVYGTDAALVRDGVGLYHLDVITDENKEWHFRFEGTGTCTAVEESSFYVHSEFPAP